MNRTVYISIYQYIYIYIYKLVIYTDTNLYIAIGNIDHFKADN